MNKEFEFIKLKNEAIRECNEVATLFSIFWDNLQTMCPPGRELSLVKTKLQEACFFAKKSISLEPSNWKDNNE